MEPLANTVKQCCQRLNCSNSTIYLALDGEIESFVVGSRRLISERELQRFIARSELIDRINRLLEKKAPPSRVKMRALSRKRYPNGGRYFIVGADDKLISSDVDLIAIGMELNVLRPGDEDCIPDRYSNLPRVAA